MYKLDIIDSIGRYIECEFNDSTYYNELAKLAPSDISKNMLINLSNDEKSHAEKLLQAYYYISDRMYVIKPIVLPEIKGYGEGLKLRMMAESEEYKKYGTHYIEEKNEFLRDLFFSIRSSEAQHVMRLPMLLDECACQ